MTTNPEMMRRTAAIEASRKALYHHERGRKFRPTRREFATGLYNCPYCATQMVKTRIRLNEHGYSCPGCHWTIHRDDIWTPTPDETPEVRGPGEATADDDLGDDLVLDLDMSVEDVMEPEPDFEMGVEDLAEPEEKPVVLVVG
jgi:predicted RNA-binding Zn-ribbon protein involved in translation (DUF1610 family)